MRINGFVFLVILSLVCGGLIWAFEDCIPRTGSSLADYGWAWSADSHMSDIPRMFGSE